MLDFGILFSFIGIGNLSSSSPESRNVAQRGRSNIKFRAPEETSVVIALLALIGFVGILRPNFLQMNNLLNLGASYAITALLAAGLVYLLALGEIDLSFGWILNFSAVIAGLSMISGIPVWISVGGAVGLVDFYNLDRVSREGSTNDKALSSGISR
jgi:ABC-type xylose transport system permease subunit